MIQYCLALCFIGLKTLLVLAGYDSVNVKWMWNQPLGDLTFCRAIFSGYSNYLGLRLLKQQVGYQRKAEYEPFQL